MGAVSLALATGSTFDFRGKPYTLSPWTFEIQAEFEKHLEREAVAAHSRLSVLLSPEQSDKALGMLLRDIAVGVYTFGGDAVGKALDSSKHSRHIIWLMLRKNDQTVTRDMVDEMFKEAGGQLMTAARLANSDPNVKAPTPSPVSGTI